jgi:hypothetical protein
MGRHKLLGINVQQNFQRPLLCGQRGRTSASKEFDEYVGFEHRFGLFRSHNISANALLISAPPTLQEQACPFISRP